MRNVSKNKRNRGMALIAAIAMLVIFAMLGTAYIGYMTIEFDETGIHLQEVRAQMLAESGATSAIAEMQAAIAHGEALKPDYTISLATYRQEATGIGAYAQNAHVRWTDESGRVNLNYAPAALLRALGFPDAAAQALMDYRAAGKRLVSVEALRTDGLLDAHAYQALDPALFTVYTGSDQRQPHSYLNLNAASERVLAAVFGINPEEAKALAEKRPFASWADALQKVGREPGTFNVVPPASAPRDMPQDLALDSRCFRIMSTVEMNMPGGTGRSVAAGVEAVVAFPENGATAVRYWRELHSGAAKAVAGEAPESPAL